MKLKPCKKKYKLVQTTTLTTKISCCKGTETNGVLLKDTLVLFCKITFSFVDLNKIRNRMALILPNLGVLG
ncbi:hypothetical protein GCM10022388_18210 [Flavobacterium chungnamense]|uniref:Uncharacterized protein n=1 Tax=Flavobacterium chungnamense TaxID=706182 RepID=A0ABP7UTL7_9FLAO